MTYKEPQFYQIKFPLTFPRQHLKFHGYEIHTARLPFSMPFTELKWFLIFPPKFPDTFRGSTAEPYDSLTPTLTIHTVSLKTWTFFFSF
jgi:hypothetical protein